MDVVITLADRSQVHVQIEDGRVVHVATRERQGRVWGPPFDEDRQGIFARPSTWVVE